MLELLRDAEALEERLKLPGLSVVQFAGDSTLNLEDARLITFAEQFIRSPSTGLSLYKIEEKNNEPLFERHFIGKLPTFIFFLDGTELTRLVQPSVDEVKQEVCDRLSDGRKIKKLQTSLPDDATRDDEQMSSTSKELNESLSKEFVGDIVGFNIGKLYKKATVFPGDLIDLNNNDLSQLNEEIFCEMRSMIEETEFPGESASDSMKQQFVLSMIRKVIQFVKRVHRLEGHELKWSAEEFDFEFCMTEKDVIPDLPYIVLNGLANGQTTPKTYCAMVECRKDRLTDGVKQALTYLREIYVLNADHKTVYVFLGDPVEFQFLSYNESSGFKLCKNINFLFPEMLEQKSHWIEKYTSIVKIVYSVLCNRLNLPRN